MNREQISVLSDDEVEEKLEQVLQLLEETCETAGKVYYADGFFFIVEDGKISEISEDVEGNSLEVFSAPSDEQHDYLEKLMDKYGIDDDFFSDYSDFDEGIDWDEEDIEEAIKDSDDEDAIKAFRKMRRDIASGKAPFESLYDLSLAFRRYYLELGDLYYWWEGEYVDLHENISDYGDERGEIDDLDDREWLYVLSNLNEFLVVPENG